MSEQLQNDLINIDNLLEAVKLQGLDFLKQLSDRPTSTKQTVQLNENLNGQFSRRLQYPSSEFSTNSANVPEVNLLDRIWWDQN